MKNKYTKVLLLLSFTLYSISNYAQSGSYLPQKMEYAHVVRISDNSFLIVSQSNCNAYRKVLHPEFESSMQDSSVSVVYQYDADKGKFKIISSTPTCRLFGGKAYSNNTLYLAGGLNSSMQVSNDLIALDVATGQWKKLPPMKHKRHMFVMECINNTIFSLNGVGNAGKYEVFDISTNKWSAIEPIKKGASVEHIDSIAASDVIDASIYFISMNGKKLFEYHTGDNLLSSKASAPFVKSEFCYNANNKKVYVADGTQQGKLDGRMYVYHSLSDKWEAAGYNPFARTRESMFFFNNSLYIIGGLDPTHQPTDIITISKPMK